MQNKSSISRGRIKDQLKANPLFSRLTDTQMNSIIDDAVRDVANFRIMAGKNDYLTDTNLESNLTNPGSGGSALSTTFYDGQTEAITLKTGLNHKESLAIVSITLQADPENSSDVFVGDFTSQSIRLEPGSFYTVSVDDITKVYVRSLQGVQLVNWTAQA